MKLSGCNAEIYFTKRKPCLTSYEIISALGTKDGKTKQDCCYSYLNHPPVFCFVAFICIYVVYN